MNINFEKVTLLITHYNRSKSLERLLQAFKNLNINFGDIVVSDDGSKEEHLAEAKRLQTEYKFNLVTTPQNKGLGNNINKGQKAVKTEYTLYVQEDFVPTEIFPEKFKISVKIMNDRKDIDMVRFYSYKKYPYLKPYGNGFSEMEFNFLYPGYRKFHYYSDHPHLRRSNFLEKFGEYTEGKNPERTEYFMMISFLQKKGKAMYYENYHDLFQQYNTATEPSTMKRNFWRNNNNIFVALTREIYRHVRHNLDYLFYKPS